MKVSKLLKISEEEKQKCLVHYVNIANYVSLF